MSVSGSEILVFGGRGVFAHANGSACDYFVSLDTEKMAWERPNCSGTGPPPRHGHTTTAIGTHLIVFGGWENSRAVNEVVVIRDVTQ